MFILQINQFSKKPIILRVTNFKNIKNQIKIIIIFDLSLQFSTANNHPIEILIHELRNITQPNYLFLLPNNSIIMAPLNDYSNSVQNPFHNEFSTQP